MNRRCFNCKKLEEESTVKFYKRTKLNPDAVFLCKACKKKKEPCERKAYVRKPNKIDPEMLKKLTYEKRVEEGRKKRHMIKYGFMKNGTLTIDCEGNGENKITTNFYPLLRN